MSSATIVTIKGKSYEFVNKDGKTALYFSARTTPRADRDKAIREVPPYWFITRSSGELLFALKPKTLSFKIISAQLFYDNFKGQWFEPLAENYYEIVWIHLLSKTQKSAQHQAYKHFTWTEVASFIQNKSLAAPEFFQNLRGDWKQSSDGADGYLLTFINGMPYWSDAVGQIPFSIFCYLNESDVSVDEEQKIKKTVDVGIKFGTGIPLDSPDKENTYDNYFVLRGAIWSSKKYKSSMAYDTSSYQGTKMKISTTDHVADELSKPISIQQRDKYGIWRNS